MPYNTLQQLKVTSAECFNMDTSLKYKVKQNFLKLQKNMHI